MDFKAVLTNVLDKIRKSHTEPIDKFRFLTLLLTIVEELENPDSVIPEDVFSGLDADTRRGFLAIIVGALVEMVSQKKGTPS